MVFNDVVDVAGQLADVRKKRSALDRELAALREQEKELEQRLGYLLHQDPLSEREKELTSTPRHRKLIDTILEVLRQNPGQHLRLEEIMNLGSIEKGQLGSARATLVRLADSHRILRIRHGVYALESAPDSSSA